jgi:putative transposase
MPRRLRLCLAGVPLHIIQRGNNRNACFFGDSDRLCYLGVLGTLAPQFDCAVHAYVLMGNHVHLLLTPGTDEGASLLMANVGQRYVQYINRTYRRVGSLWQGRFRSCLVDTDSYFLRCQRYVELNPVRAGIVSRPEDYPWSSHRANGLGVPDALVTPHACYFGLGADAGERQARYRSIVVEQEFVDFVRKAASAGYAVGSDEFRSDLERRFGCRVGPGRNGRPRSRSESAKPWSDPGFRFAAAD